MFLLSIIDEVSYLAKTIESLRNEMIKIGIQEGLTSEKTIAISQLLDIYIAKYQALIKC